MDGIITDAMLAEQQAKLDQQIEDLSAAIASTIADRARLAARVRVLEEALGKAQGFMTNAAIDLETGAPKRTAIATINGGIAIVRAALSAVAAPATEEKTPSQVDDDEKDFQRCWHCGAYASECQCDGGYS